MKLYISLLIMLAICGIALVVVLHLATGSAGVVSISVIIDKAEYFDQLSSWLQSIGFAHFTFVIDDYFASDYVLNNATRLGLLQRFGEIIPRLPYMQQNTTAERTFWIDSVTTKYTAKLGSAPKGVMDYVPDTASANYLATKGYTYIQGYCQDQWAVDAISELGGWQLPYYASSNHILVPDNSSVAKGLVVLPHATADWVDSYTVWQGIQLHPMNLMTLYNNDTTAAKTYFLALIDRTLKGCSPVGFANIQFEWSWCVDFGLTNTAKDWISSVLSHNGLTAQYQVLTYATFVDWFKSAYKNTPEYRVLFTSPYNASDSIEWYYSTTSRVARVDGYVVSFIDYTKQITDKYLTSTQYINWAGQMQGDPNNCIDDSLVMTISALGGGLMRYPAIDTQRVSYAGDLGSFSSTYYNAQVINTLDMAEIAALTTTAVLAVLAKTKNV